MLGLQHILECLPFKNVSFFYNRNRNYCNFLSADCGQREIGTSMKLGRVFSHLTLGHGCKCMPEDSVSIGDVLVVISEQVGGGSNIKSASRMNKVLVIFFKAVSMVDELLEKGLVVKNIFLPVLPLSNPSKKVVLSNVLK